MYYVYMKAILNACKTVFSDWLMMDGIVWWLLCLAFPLFFSAGVYSSGAAGYHPAVVDTHSPPLAAAIQGDGLGKDGGKGLPFSSESQQMFISVLFVGLSFVFWNFISNEMPLRSRVIFISVPSFSLVHIKEWYKLTVRDDYFYPIE